MVIFTVIKTIQPYVLRLLSNDVFKNGKRALHRVNRQLKRKPACLSVFVKIDDPYSYLLIQALPSIEARFNVTFDIKVICSVQNDMFPEPELWARHALLDANHVASLYQFEPLPAPSAWEMHEDCERRDIFAMQLQNAVSSGKAWNELAGIFKQYWNAEITTEQAVSGCTMQTDTLRALLSENSTELTAKGHYLPATVHFEGEWYWGVDRLNHLEQRLIIEKLGKSEHTEVVYNRDNSSRITFDSGNLSLPPPQTEHNAPIELFWSARSPYSFIALFKAIKLASVYKLPLEVKPVLPMMMRGLNVPRKKAFYIFFDTTREAHELGIEYGFVADPLGAAVERCYALIEFARQNNRYLEYLIAFARGVNAKGIRADTDKGMKQIVEEAGLSWDEAKCHLTDSHWKDEVVSNQNEMYALGNWGVPVFRYKTTTVWGQDRMFVIENALQEEQQIALAREHTVSKK